MDGTWLAYHYAGPSLHLEYIFCAQLVTSRERLRRTSHGDWFLSSVPERALGHFADALSLDSNELVARVVLAPAVWSLSISSFTPIHSSH